MKKLFMLFVMVCIAGMMIAGCQSSGSGEGGTGAPQEKATELSESDKNLAKIREAYADFYASPMRETKLRTTYEFNFGRKDDNVITTILDTDRQIVFLKTKRKTSGAEHEMINGTIKYQDYYTVEDGTDYRYSKRKKHETTYDENAWSDTKSKQVWYKIKLPKENDKYNGKYSDYADRSESFLENDSFKKIRNIVITENGHKDINGIDTIEYNAEYEVALADYTDTSREEKISDYGLEEKIIKKIDGMSECIDSYVEEENKYAEKMRGYHTATMGPVYLNAETGELTQVLDINDYDDQNKYEEDLMTYYEKYNYYQMHVETDGEKEVLKKINSKDFKPETNTQWMTKKTTRTDYYTGETCDKIPDLPEKVTKIKSKEFFEEGYENSY